MSYDLKRQTERLGMEGAELAIELETIADLDQAIDRLCEGVDVKAQHAVFVESLCPYFGVLWPAARALSEHLARMGGWLKDKSVLELGCGLALPSLVAAKLGARVTAADFHPDVPKFLARNMELNGLTERQLTYREYDWRKSDGTVNGDTFDFVVGSDILYESSHPQDVARALAARCAPAGSLILTDPGRVYLQSCIDALGKLGFRSDMFVREVYDPRADRAGDKKTKEVFVFTLQRR